MFYRYFRLCLPFFPSVETGNYSYEIANNASFKIPSFMNCITSRNHVFYANDS